jgi:hypothetical protein
MPAESLPIIFLPRAVAVNSPEAVLSAGRMEKDAHP